MSRPRHGRDAADRRRRAVRRDTDARAHGREGAAPPAVVGAALLSTPAIRSAPSLHFFPASAATSSGPCTNVPVLIDGALRALQSSAGALLWHTSNVDAISATFVADAACLSTSGPRCNDGRTRARTVGVDDGCFLVGRPA